MPHLGRASLCPRVLWAALVVRVAYIFESEETFSNA